ncbi:MAG: amino acid adenylation domain-containing protein [Candidatus Aminicenantes bacterium]|nr:amino acid adenylation domain-containing protein [Candidatus Aminicenantes bacterium]NIM82456.1 amino acid adenylation domain-containing protein [Candidatus Aminicenantes bacterium]NIN21817.1 amino acid adenylation domain-containing protein [Candidatus Aminicenantes bacterium]NIN45609.1 amino acid adenylation domain-containing protein [Candidatus Aminicenantes bacterium]NIN88440.1 amino acid adenylation domain-containing protein [Candidatus Aminicenantes bacterium]
MNIEGKLKNDFGPSEKKDYYELSSAQKRFYILHQMEPQCTKYNISTLSVLEGELDLELLENIFQRLINRHESLRTSFILVEGKPVQKIYKHVEFKIEYDEADRPEEAILKDFVRPFDLSRPPLLRVRLSKINEKKHLLIFDMHQITADAASQVLLKKELMALYAGKELESSSIQYKDYAEWQKHIKQEDWLKSQEEYWLNMIAGKISVLNLPTDYLRPAIQSFEGDSSGFEISSEETTALKTLALEQETTLYVVFLAIFNVFLSIVSNQETIRVGTPVSGRIDKDIENVLGVLENKLVLVNDPVGEKTFIEFLGEVKKKTLEVFTNQDYPYEDLVDKVAADTDMSRNPLFDIMYEFMESDYEIPEMEISSLKLRRYKYGNEIGTTGLDLTLRGFEEGDRLFFTFEFCTKVYKEETIKRFIAYFKRIVSSIITEPLQKIGAIEILSEAEKNQLLCGFNDTSSHYPRDKTIHELFEEQADRAPDKVAVVMNNEFIKYRELNMRANRVARMLRKKGVGANSIVAMMLEPSINTIIGIFGVLKAGGAYLPIDPDYPKDRITFLLNDSTAKILLTDTKSIKKYPFTVLQGLNITNDSIQVKVTGTRSQIKDLDHLPIPNRSLVDYEKYNQYIGQAMVKHCISVQSTRGCPYKCAYCHKIWPKTHVWRSAESIFAEIKLYYDMGVRRFAFIDDIFNLNIKNSSRVLNLIIENGLDIQIFFPNGVRGDILTKEYIDLLVQAGTVDLAFALETASPRLQKLIRKNLNLEKFRENLEYVCQKYPHVIVELFTMHGYPSETKEEARMTLDFIKSIKWLHFPYVFVLMIYPNTDMEKLALENGVSREAILASQDKPFHELPETLPFDKSFTLKYQTEFTSEYFLSKERLVQVLPYQLKILTESEVIQKYNSYLPIDINCLDDLLEFAGITYEELGVKGLLNEDYMEVPDLNNKMRNAFASSSVRPSKGALRVLLLDLSQHFSRGSDQLFDLIEPPLGLMYLMTYLNHRFGSNIKGRIAKSMIDFNSYGELKLLLDEFKPEIIGIRTLTLFKDFFHETVSRIRQFGVDAPIIAGGPYATSTYQILLMDRNIDLVVLGEGEITFSEIIGKMIENDGKFLHEHTLNKIRGIAFIPKSEELSNGLGREIIFMDDLPKETLNEDGENLHHVNQPQDLAYVIYTSGTTGKPKGTLTTHSNVIRVVRNSNYIDLTENDRILQLSSYTFDGSVFDIYGALLNGALLLMVKKEDVLSPEVLAQLIKKEEITVFFVTTALFNALVDINVTCFDPVRKVLFGGERVSVKHTGRALEYLGKDRIIHVYGPTETTVYATYFFVNEIDRNLDTIPIGKPISNTTVFILDNRFKPVPIGVKGEIYIGGDGVARGYLNSPELTWEKFIPNPFTVEDRLYRTGDLARWLLDGNIEFFGRIDHQVKIRGYRVELDEIKNHLEKYHQVKEAVVLVKEDDTRGKHLIAYIVPSTDEPILLTELTKFLSFQLPAYMIPSYFVPLKQFPLTANGKIDRKALPDPGGISLDSGVEYIAPENEVEMQLVEIMSRVLGRPKIGIHEDFFMIGGDSIKAIQVAARMNEAGFMLKVKDIFQNPQISLLASLVKVTERIGEQTEITGTFPLTPFQKWFLKNKAAGSCVFSQGVVLYSKKGFDDGAVEAVFKKIQAHHDVLRITFNQLEDGEILQTNHGLEYPLSLQVFDLKKQENALKTVETKSREIQAGIDLENGPLMKIGLFHQDDGDRLLIAAHPLVIDDISWGILLEDIDRLFQQYRNGELFKLPSKAHSFKLWSEKLSCYAESETISKEKTHWAALESVEVPEIAGDKKGINLFIEDTASMSFHLNENETLRLLTKTNEPFGTETADILLIALALAMNKTFGHTQVAVTLESDGRPDIFEGINISRTLGCFRTLYPVLMNVSFEDDLVRQIKEIKECLHQVPNKGIGYGILRYLAPAKQGDQPDAIDFRLNPQSYFKYRGERDDRVSVNEHPGSFTIAKELAALPFDLGWPGEFDLEFQGMIVDKRLVMSLYFNKKYKKETIETLLNNYKTQLIRIITFCGGRKERVLTPSDLTYKGLSIESLDRLTQQYQIEDIYKLSPLQEGMLFHSIYEKEKVETKRVPYFLQTFFRIKIKLDLALVKKSLSELIKRHDILRTVFIYRELGYPLQVVLKDQPLNFYYKDISGMNEEKEKEEFTRKFKEKDRYLGFDLGKDSLMRVAVIQLEESEYEFVWSIHHILMDGWCVSILIFEYFEIYSSLFEGKSPQLPAVTPYKKYIEWLEIQNRKKAIDYWLKYLANYKELTGLPKKDAFQVSKNEYKYEQEFLILDNEMTNGLNQLAGKNQVTLNTILQAVWGIVLGGFVGKQDAVFGTVVSGRPSQLKGVESMVGLFINTIPVRIRFEEKTKFINLAKKIQEEAVECQPYHYYSLAEIQAQCALKQGLLDHIFVFENLPGVEHIASKMGLNNSKDEITLDFSNVNTYDPSNYDLNVIILPRDQLTILLNYNGNVYEREVMERTADCFNRVIEQILKNRDIYIGEVDLLSEAEKEEILARKEEDGEGIQIDFDI